MRIVLALDTLTRENRVMRSWMNDRFDQLKTALQKLQGISSGRFKHKALAEVGVRASVAVAGILLIVGSIGVAMGFSSQGSLHRAFVAMLPFSLEEELPPLALAGVTAYGEIVPARELSLSSRASGLIKEISLDVGDAVEEGALIARVDDAEAQRVVRDAQASLTSAELALSRVGSRASGPNDSARADTLATAFDNAYLEMSQMFPSLPDIVSGLSGILYGGGFSDGGMDYLIAHADRISFDNDDIEEVRDRTADRFVVAKEKYTNAKDDFHRISSNSDNASIEALLMNTQEAVGALSDATKAADELFAFIQNHFASLKYAEPAVFQEYEEALNNYSSQLNDQLALLNGTVENIRSLRGAGNGQQQASNPDIERKEAELEVTLARNRLQDAKAQLENYEVKAPFSGVIAGIEKKKAEYVADGETVAKLVASDTLALVSLAQGEVVRVKTGQTALISFEGSDIEVRGRVAEIEKGKKDADGIVRFAVTIALEKDDRIKPGMRIAARFLEN